MSNYNHITYIILIPKWGFKGARACWSDGGVNMAVSWDELMFLPGHEMTTIGA